MLRRLAPFAATLAVGAIAFAAAASAQDEALAARVARLEAEVQSAEDVSALKKLQRMYGYYLDKGMWADLAELFADDAVANYPAGVYVGAESIRKHLYLNVGGGEIGEVGLREGRLYNHMNIQPVVHVDPGGRTAKGRWRAFAMFGSFGDGATWAEGVYEMTYVKDGGVWKIKTLDYHAGFGAPYSTGWVAPEEPRRGGGRRNLPHPPDRERSMPCEGFPAACIAPFHYPNPGTPAGARVWRNDDAGTRTGGQPLRARALRERATELARRATLLEDEQRIENLVKAFGYYYDRRLWDEVAALFADDGTIEMDLRGVYVGRDRIRQFLDFLGPEGLGEGELNDHVHLQVVVNVAPDGRTAKSRSRSLNMTGAYGSHGEWSEGSYENTYVKEDGVWKLQSLRYFPTFISDYDKGWGADAKPAPTASETLPPDRPPTDVYDIYPRPHIPPYHYRNPVSGSEPLYPRGAGRPSERAIAAALAPVPAPREPAAAERLEPEELIAETERRIERVRDYHEIENLENAYGYYLDKNLWTELAQLFAAVGSMELAQRGAYVGRDRVREFLFAVFGQEGPVEGRLGNHVKMQPVIEIAPDGQSATIRSRMMQQLSFGNRASMGAAVYENVAVKEDGIWKFAKVHAYNTWTAGYDGGWIRSSTGRVPGPSERLPPDRPPTLEFAMYPAVYAIPFEQPHPVTGRRVLDKPSAGVQALR